MKKFAGAHPSHLHSTPFTPSTPIFTSFHLNTAMFSSLARRSLRHPSLSSFAVPLVSRFSLHNTQAASTLATQSLKHRAFSTSFSLKRFENYAETTQNHPVDEAIASDPQHEVSQSTSKNDMPTRFQQLEEWGMIDSKIIKNITEGMNYDTMTKVQSRTIAETLAGGDV
jgi:ATP-dependent RNA helicase MSS116